MSELRDKITAIITDPGILEQLIPVLSEFEEKLAHVDNHEACIAEMTKAFDEALTAQLERADKAEAAIAEANKRAAEKNNELAQLDRQFREEKAEHKKTLQQRMRWIAELQEKLDAFDAVTTKLQGKLQENLDALQAPKAEGSP